MLSQLQHHQWWVLDSSILEFLPSKGVPTRINVKHGFQFDRNLCEIEIFHVAFQILEKNIIDSIFDYTKTYLFCFGVSKHDGKQCYMISGRYGHMRSDNAAGSAFDELMMCKNTIKLMEEIKHIKPIVFGSLVDAKKYIKFSFG